MKLNSILSIFLLVALALFSCDSKKWEVATEKIMLEQDYSRFDLDVMALKKDGISQDEWNLLTKKYPNFFPLYIEGIVGFGRMTDPLILTVFNQYLRNNDILEVLEHVKNIYPEESLKTEFEVLKNGFRRYHYYFTERIIPDVVTMTAAFNYATAADDQVLAIGLDMYLGGDFQIYPKIGIPKYKFQNFNRSYIVPDAMKAWLLTEFETAGAQDLLDQMVYYGKVAYLSEAFLPNHAKHLFFNYSPQDLAWCEDNEGPIWFHFIDLELLFSTENQQIRKYMGDSPFVAGFPEGSPGRVGQWVGYQLVKSFMENNQNVDLEGLMEIQDANRILRMSNYKPQR
tara:strand:+ start:26786 stop:27808 length:1023 start_codon:yes stop_codon:yes gene_type:complete